MTAPKDSQLTKILVPVIVALIGSQGWQFYATPDKIKEVTKTEVDNILIKKLEYKIDSLSKSLISKEYAKGSLTSAVSDIKQLDGDLANIYLKEVFKVADEAISNHEKWKGEQLPFLIGSMNKRYLCPVQNVETGELLFQGVEDNYKIRLGKPKEMKVGDKKLDVDIYFYNDVLNEITPIKSLRKPIYK